jgi:DNA-binding SARP family transcriptional activator
MKSIKHFCLLLFLVFSGFVYGQLPQTGLFFYSHGRNIDERTSLLLNDGNPYKLDVQDNFTLAFDVFFRDELVKFGYVFRIVSNKGENFDFIINNDPSIFFIVNNQDFRLKNPPSVNQWNRVVVSFNKQENTISFRFNDEQIDFPHQLQNIRSLNISFGKCDYRGSKTHDVAPFILKDVRVVVNDKEIHHWILNRHAESVVYDELKNMPARVHNPYWLMNNRIYWREVAKLGTSFFPQIAFDSIANKVHVLTKNELISYSLLTNSVINVPNRKVDLDNELQNHFIFDPISKKLLYYGFEPGQKIFYDPVKNTWSNNLIFEEDDLHAHHNRYISLKDSSLYLFGGYGQYKYNSSFFKINLYTDEFKKSDLSHSIIPRYLAAVGGNKAGDKIYIFGGRGAEMGRQELSPKNFSDLYEIDLQTNKVNFLFDIKREDEDGKVFSNGLVMTEDGKSFYVLAFSNNHYSSSIQLKKINMKTRQVEKLGNPIEFYFRDITSFCDLYFSPSLSKLIAVVSYLDEEENFQIHIYTLDYPPLQLKDVIQTSPESSNAMKFVYVLFIGVCLTIILIIFRKKILNNEGNDVSTSLSNQNKKNEEDIQNEEQELTDISEEDTNTEEIQKYKSVYDFGAKAILFLGGFQVFDKNRKNITGDFTPTLKYILVLIILYTLKNNKGISSSKLQEFLWFDKTEEAARNNRSVNLRKLRVLLQKVGDVDITNQNGYWTISLSDDVLSDYKEVLQLIHKIHQDDITEKNDLLQLLELLQFGVILPNIQLEWVDSFKTDFSNSVIDLLMQVVNNEKNNFYKDQNIRLKIADCILKIDLINEEALAIKCKALYAMGKKGLAKTTLDNFSKEYNLLLGELYKGSIKDLTGQ